MRESNQVLEPQEMPAGFLVFLLLMPLMTPVVVIGATFFAILIGISGFAASGSGGVAGAIFGVIFLVLVVKFGYLFLPLASFLSGFSIYLAICGFEELFGYRLVVPVGEANIQLRIVSFFSTLSTGLVSFLIFWGAYLGLGISKDEYLHSQETVTSAYETFLGSVRGDLELLSLSVTDIGMAALLVIAVTVIWWLAVYIGGNYWFSRSVSYCLHVFVLAFFLDVSITLVLFFTADSSTAGQPSSLLANINALDHEFRRIVILPIEVLVSAFSDLDPLVEAVTRLFGSAANVLYALLELGLGIVTIRLEDLREKLLTLINFARFLRVDFLSFALASLIQFTRLKICAPRPEPHK